jgi:hypothetical protein
MKHLKTFESFNTNINEEIFGLSKDERDTKKSKKRQSILEMISKHRTYNQLVDFVVKQYNEDKQYVTDRLVDAFIEYGSIPGDSTTYPKAIEWNKEKRIFEDKTKYSSSIPGLG